MNAYINFIKSHIEDKRHVVITGAIGRGKTTLLNQLRCVLGAEESLPGLITWNERGKAVYMREIGNKEYAVIGEFNPNSASTGKRMKLVPEGFNIFGVSILEKLINDNSEWVTVDEIGYLEAACQSYLEKLTELFEKKRVIAVVRKQNIAHIKEIINRKDTLVIDLDNMKRVNLEKTKNVIFLGSSVTYGYASGGVSFADFMQEKYGFNMIKEAVSGTTLVDKDNQSYISRLKSINATQCDLFVCQLSTNDATLKMPIKDIEGAIDYIIDYAERKWNCQVVFYTNPKYDSAEYTAMVELIKKKVVEKQILLINMWDDIELNRQISQKRDYYMADAIHPTKEGYKEIFVPFMEKYLN